MSATLIYVDETLPFAAADLCVRHPLPMADGVIPATARSFIALPWTQDEHVLRLEVVRSITKPHRSA